MSSRVHSRQLPPQARFDQRPGFDDVRPRCSTPRERNSGTFTARTAKPRRVLLAEDCAANRELTRLLLERLNCVVDEASDGERVLELMAGGRYDLVFMDISMPFLDGIEAARRIRASGDRTPIVALSAYVGAEFAERCADAEMNGHLTKPITLKVLRDSMSAIFAPKSTDVFRAALARPTTGEIAFDPSPLRVLLADLDDGEAGGNSLFARVTSGFRRDLELLSDELASALDQAEDSGTAVRARDIAHKLGALANTVGVRSLGRLALLIEQGRAGPQDRLGFKRVAAVGLQAFSDALAGLERDRLASQGFAEAEA